MNVLKSLDKVQASEELIQDTLTYCKENGQKNMKIRKVIPMKRRLVVAGIASAMIVLSTGSVFAYNYVKNNGAFKPNNMAQSMDHLDAVTDENGNTYQYEQAAEINQTVESKNLSVTFLSYAVDTHKVIFSAEVRTTDGSAINEMNENHVATIARDRFREVTITVDGNKVDLSGITSSIYGRTGAYCNTQRVDDGSDPACAKFEITYEDNRRELYNANIGITLKDYLSDYTDYEAIGFQFNSIAEMIQNETMASAEAFSTVEDVAKNQKIVLAPGNMHIAFADQYPEAYIDNAGFINDTDRTNSPLVFVMTIVPGTDANAAKLQKLVYQNKINGLLIAETRKLEDGRILMEYSCNDDFYYRRTQEGIYYDVTNEHLANIVPKILIPKSENRVISFNEQFSTVSDGTWSYVMDVNADPDNRPIEMAMDMKITDSNDAGKVLNVEKFSISSTELLISGTSETESISSTNSGEPIITMKNGTSFKTGNKSAGSGASEGNIKNFGWTLPTVIDVNDVQSVTWHGSVLYTAK